MRGAFALVAGALLVAGCGAAADGPSPPVVQDARAATVAPRPVDAAKVRGSLELMAWQSNPVEAKLLRSTIAEFEREHPRIDVRLYSYSGDYPSGIMTRFAGENPPDVFAVNASYAPDWIAKGMLLPIDGYAAGNDFDTDVFHQVLLDAFRGHDSLQYGIPKDYSTLGLYVNTEMLRDAGITEPPTTWPQLADAARRLTTRDRHGICLPASWDRLALFAAQAEGGLVNARGDAMIAGSARTREAIDFYLSFFEEGIGTTPAAAGTAWCGDAFGKRKVAMAIEGNWLVPPLHNSFPDVKWEVAEVPAGRRRATLAYAPAWGIAAGTEHPDAAWVLLSYLTSRTGMQRWTHRGLALPSRSDVPVVPAAEPFTRGLPYAQVFQLPPGFATKVFLTAENELTAVLEGDQSVDEMTRRIDAVGTSVLRPPARTGGDR